MIAICVVHPEQLQAMSYLVSATLILVAITHLLPVVGVAGSAQLARLYRVDTSDPNLRILMQHGAVLFALVGGFMIHAAFNPRFQFAAFTVGFISVLSFILIALGVGAYSARLARVIRADLLALVLLVIGVGALLLS